MTRHLKQSGSPEVQFLCTTEFHAVVCLNLLFIYFVTGPFSACNKKEDIFCCCCLPEGRCHGNFNTLLFAKLARGWHFVAAVLLDSQSKHYLS